MERPLAVTITPMTIIAAVMVLGGAWLLYELFDVVLVLLTAIVIASGVEPATTWLSKRKIPRVLSILMVYIVLLGVIFGVLYVFVPMFLLQSALFLAALPQYLQFLGHIPGEYSPILSAIGADPVSSVTHLVDGMRAMVHDFTGDPFRTVSTFFGGVLSFILIIVFSFYFSLQERGIEDFLRLVTPLRHEDYVIGLWKRVQRKLGLWVFGQLLLGVIVGVLVFLLLTILGIPHALVLAVIAGVFELVPVFGPTLSAAPAVMVALADGGITMGLIVIAVYVIIQQFENHLIYPLVVTKVVGVPPLMIILGLIIGGKLAGFLGLILSAPLASVIQELLADYDVSRGRKG